MAETTYNELYRLLRDDIIKGHYPIGSRLTINDIAKRYGVSHIPVREALSLLSVDKLVEIIPRRGARVCKFSDAFIEDVYQLRSTLECLFLQNSIPHFTDGDVEELRSVNAELRNCTKNNELSRVLPLNFQFHSILFKYNTNKEALDCYNVYSGENGLIGVLRNLLGYSPTRLEVMNEDHQMYIELAAAKDIPALKLLTIKHSEGAKADVLTSLSAISGT